MKTYEQLVLECERKVAEVELIIYDRQKEDINIPLGHRLMLPSLREQSKRRLRAAQYDLENYLRRNRKDKFNMSIGTRILERNGK